MMMSSVVEVKFVKTKVFFRYYTKVFHVQIPVSKLEKNEKVGKTILSYKTGQKRDFKSGQKDYKAGQKFQIVAKRFCNRDRYCKSGQEGFQIRARITNRSRDYKSVQNN